MAQVLNNMYKIITTILVLWIAAVISEPPSSSELNRCGDIKQDRNVYYRFDATNGHNLLEVKITTNSTVSGFTWQDILNDRTKWDDNEPWVHCLVTIGRGLPFACTAERRGDWSMESELPSLKVKFAGARYKGMDRLLLNKHPWDPTRVKTKLTHELLQYVDHMSSLFTQFATLTVDGQFYGVYTMIEDMDKHMLQSHGMNSSSLLYKANNVRWNLERDRGVREVSDPLYSKASFEKYWDIRGRTDHTQLINAYRDVFDANLDSRTVILKHFNAVNLATWLAFVYITANTDMVHNNYAIFAPTIPSAPCQNGAPFYHLSWDNDGAWDDRYFDGSHLSFPYYEEGVQYFWRNRVVKRFLQVNEFVDLLQIKMNELIIDGPFSPFNISALTRVYKFVLTPLLLLPPDNTNIAWDASVEDWIEEIDEMSSIPTAQHQKFPVTLRRPMPINIYMNFSDDSSSLFFYWDKSFILYDKPYYYEFRLATDKSFETSKIVRTIKTDSKYITIAASELLPSTVYFWSVKVRNSVTDEFIDAYQSLHEKGDWGMLSFTSPPSLAPLSAAPPVIPITREESITDQGVTFRYATLDNVHPASVLPSTPNQPLLLPPGWQQAPNNNQTRFRILAFRNVNPAIVDKEDIALMRQQWGGGRLVLQDGSLLDPLTGRLLDGFGETAQHFMAKQVQGGGIAFYTVSPNVRILLVR